MKIIYPLLVTCLLLLLEASPADAAVRIWDGGAGIGDTNWSTAANWSGDIVPGVGDEAYFDGTSVNSSTVDTGFSG